MRLCLSPVDDARDNSGGLTYQLGEGEKHLVLFETVQNGNDEAHVRHSLLVQLADPKNEILRRVICGYIKFALFLRSNLRHR